MTLRILTLRVLLSTHFEDNSITDDEQVPWFMIHVSAIAALIR
jgi:hypothetical protein